MATCEQNVLGAMCQDNTWETLHNGVEELENEDFFDPECLSVFISLCEIVRCGAIPTVGELSTRCTDVSRTEIIRYFTEYGLPGETFYNQYVREIRRSRVNRVIAASVQQIQERAVNGGEGAAELLEMLVDRVQNIDIGGEEMTLTDNVLAETLLSMSETTEKIRTGFIDLDKILGGGYGRGTLNAIGGRPSMGKSTLAMNIAINVLTNRDRENVVAYFTLEETVKAFMRRVLLHLAKCGIEQIRNEDDQAIKRVIAAQNEMHRVKDRFLVMHLPGAKVGRLTALCRKFRARKKHIDLIVIDYLTLLDMGSGKKPLNQAIGDVTKALKALAAEMDAPVVLLCQLNRDSEKDGEPGMSSFKDSGNIEQDVDTAIALYRPKAGEDVPQEWQDEDERRVPPNLKVVKNRDGGYGTVPLAWMPSSYTFACVYRGVDPN